MTQIGKSNRTSGMKELKRRYPVKTGLGNLDKHEGRQINLVPEQGTLYARRKRAGITPGL